MHVRWGGGGTTLVRRKSRSIIVIVVGRRKSTWETAEMFRGGMTCATWVVGGSRNTSFTYTSEFQVQKIGAGAAGRTGARIQSTRTNTAIGKCTARNLDGGIRPSAPETCIFHVHHLGIRNALEAVWKRNLSSRPSIQNPHLKEHPPEKYATSLP